MTAQHNGGPAFPTTAGQVVYSNGMSMRDWFAGQALVGLCAAHDASGLWTTEPIPLAKMAYQVADAMLSARGGNHE